MHSVGGAAVSCSEGWGKVLALVLLGLYALSQVPPHTHAVTCCYSSLPAGMTNISPLRLSPLWTLVAWQ